MSFANFTIRGFERGRIGFLSLSDDVFTTPLLFPVACLITGTTPRGGGIWKYILQAHPHGLMRRNNPIITQALHFLDFSMSHNALEQWRTKTLKDHYNQQFPDLHCHAPIFMDSGGFKLLWNSELDVSKFGIQATPEAILSLQRDLGSDMIATLDYPLPPRLKSSEAKQRMQKSRRNAGRGLYLPFKWLYEHTGRRAAKAFEKINVRMPSSEEAALLTISRTQPVVDMDRWVWADDDTLFEYTHIVANAALHEYTYSYEIDEEASK